MVVPPLPGTPYPFLKLVTVLALFIALDTKFHSSTSLLEKKFLLVSSLEACCFRGFGGSEAFLVVLMVTATLFQFFLLCGSL